MNQAAAWFRARKTGTVRVHPTADRETVESHEGRETLLAGDVLCRGEAGNVWPQSEGSLLAKYGPRNLPMPTAGGSTSPALSVRASWPHV